MLDIRDTKKSTLLYDQLKLEKSPTHAQIQHKWVLMFDLFSHKFGRLANKLSVSGPPLGILLNTD